MVTLISVGVVDSARRAQTPVASWGGIEVNHPRLPPSWTKEKTDQREQTTTVRENSFFPATRETQEIEETAMRMNVKDRQLKLVLDQPAAVVLIQNSDFVDVALLAHTTGDHKVKRKIAPGQSARISVDEFNGWDIGELIDYILIRPADEKYPYFPAIEISTGIHAREGVVSSPATA